MRRLGLAVAVAGLLALPLVAFADSHEAGEANPCNPCAENPCNPCGDNPCDDNPCNPCGGD
ncbi:MAG: hypothetical protein GY937_27235 [bacterium]|nr:hypothetical protein [bacterium]